ncbi:MAG: 1-acyl-sn-glycerol-3-phosphate acyltransferase, partial [Parachlamydiales bacterium]
EKIKKYIENKENVILLANHQSEVDPMLIYIMLEEKYYDIAKDVIYVAGDRVTNDFLAIPFSMGCNLLCIYSKRYIDIDLSLKHKKQIHNKKVMSLMSSLLSQGGKTIYVAPSGGRDRKNEKGIIEVAPFDPQSLEMFYLMCKKSKNKSHFFPLALSTYDILPPPEKIQIEMGEKREVNRGFIALSFLEEIDMDNVPGSEDANKINKRKNRAKYIHNIVKEEYARISKEK